MIIEFNCREFIVMGTSSMIGGFSVVLWIFRCEQLSLNSSILIHLHFKFALKLMQIVHVVLHVRLCVVNVE